MIPSAKSSGTQAVPSIFYALPRLRHSQRSAMESRNDASLKAHIKMYIPIYNVQNKFKGFLLTFLALSVILCLALKAKEC